MDSTRPNQNAGLADVRSVADGGTVGQYATGALAAGDGAAGRWAAGKRVARDLGAGEYVAGTLVTDSLAAGKLAAQGLVAGDRVRRPGPSSVRRPDYRRPDYRRPTPHHPPNWSASIIEPGRDASHRVTVRWDVNSRWPGSPGRNAPELAGRMAFRGLSRQTLQLVNGLNLV
jgi:hypothetical protein